MFRSIPLVCLTLLLPLAGAFAQSTPLLENLRAGKLKKALSRLDAGVKIESEEKRMEVVRLLGAYLQQTPVKLIADEPVSGLMIEGDRIRGVTTQAKEYRADAVVIASGAWSSGLLGSAQIENAIRPIKGQMLLLKGAKHGLSVSDNCPAPASARYP